MTFEQVIAIVKGERQMQDEQWGTSQNSEWSTKPADAWRVLSEEMLELNQAINDGRPYIDELIQVTAVGVKWLEAFVDQNGTRLMT